MQDIALSTEHLGKKYGSFYAIKDIDFTLKKGTVHAILGTNGAGKSTFVKLLSGEISPSQGKIFINKNGVHFKSPLQAIKRGIVMVSQDFGLVDSLTIAENFSLNFSLLKKDIIYRSTIADNYASKSLKEVGLEIDIRTKVGNLSVSQKQLIAVAKAISLDAHIYIFDEPTSVLDSDQFNTIKKLIKKLVAQGKSVIYITHKIDEVFEIAQYVAIFKDGHIINNSSIDKITKSAILDFFRIGVAEKHDLPVSEKLPVLPLSRKLFISPGSELTISIDPGDCIGIKCDNQFEAIEFVRSVCGVSERYRNQILFNGHRLQPRPGINLTLFPGLIDEDRRVNGVFNELSIKDNISILNSRKLSIFGFIRQKSLASIAKEKIQQLSIRCESYLQPVSELSGGNQQKVLLARWLSSKFRYLAMIEPTTGIDVSGKEEVYRVIDSFKANKQSFIVVTSDQNELARICNKIFELILPQS